MQNQIQNPPAPEGRRNSSVSSFKQLLHRCLNLYSKYLLTTHPNKTFNKIVILLFITSCITIFACRERITPPPDTPQYIPPIVLSLEDVSCTDAFLRVRFVDTTIERSFILKRDGATVASVANSPLDTMLIDENLLPKRIYRYKAYRVKGGASVDSSMELRVETMDTTSHDFTWQIDTLGDGASSVLYDVAIINDTLAYAVGEIYKRDSLGNWDPEPYNLVKWDGKRWELKRVPFYYRGSTWYLPLRCITAFGPNDIWFEAGIHWNGKEYRTIPYTIDYPARINKGWGTSSRDFYVVGTNGLIAHYDGARWRRLESGTSLPIMDIYGARDPRTGQYEILCVSADPNIPGRSQVLAIESGTVRQIATDPMWEPWGIWFIPQRRYIHVGDGLWEAHRVSGPWVRNTQVPALFKTSVRGQAINDVVVCGAFWLLAHWNGVSWQTYFPRISNSFTSVAIKDNIIIAVGGIDNKAVIVIGRRWE